MISYRKRGMYSTKLSISNHPEGGVAPPEESPPHQERHWNDTEKIRMSHWANHVIGATDVAH